MTFGYCRDAAERSFLLKYVEERVLPANPFQTLDDAVADLMRIAVAKGRATKPTLELGICGEHGGDPASIAKCDQLGLDYVSCSPFRVPVARLAAAQAVLARRTAAAQPQSQPRPLGSLARVAAQQVQRRRTDGTRKVKTTPERPNA
jgi:phosphoenolpyruvate-protein kinase (PTS system EI component)